MRTDAPACAKLLAVLVSVSLAACGANSGNAPNASAQMDASSSDATTPTPDGAIASDGTIDVTVLFDAEAIDGAVDTGASEDANDAPDGTLDAGDAGAVDAGADSAIDGGSDAALEAEGGGGEGDAAADGNVEAGDGGFVVAPHPPMPHLQKQSGPAIASPVLVPVTFPSFDIQSDIDTFVTTLGATGSTYWSPALGDYGVGPATAGVPVHVATAAAPMIDDTTIQTWLAGMLDGTHPEFGTATSSTVYVLFYPSTTKVTNAGLTGCTDFGGYHSSIYLSTGTWAGTYVPYAVIPECANDPVLFYTTVAASHEMDESCTDPFFFDVLVGKGWVGLDANHAVWQEITPDNGGEDADLCVGFYGSNYYPIGYTYGVQRVWSNSAAAASHDPCEPSLSGEVYYNAAPVLSDTVAVTIEGQPLETNGVRIPLNTSKVIEVDLYSDAPKAPWTVSATDFSATLGGGPHLSFVWDATTGQNGTKLHLTITALAGTSRFGGEPFMITSNDGFSHHEWIGYVGQN